MKRRPCFRLPVSGDDVVRAAMAAYYRAGAEATAPMGDPSPVLWSDAESFLQTMFQFFELRLRCEASAAGHPVDCEPVRYAKWLSHPPSRDQHIRDVDPGLWEEMQAMAQGCAVLDSGAGAPLAVSHVADATAHGKPLSVAPRWQELPDGASFVDTQANRGAIA